MKADDQLGEMAKDGLEEFRLSTGFLQHQIQVDGDKAGLFPVMSRVGFQLATHQ